MQHLLQLAATDAEHILTLLRSHSPRNIARLAGYVLIARTIDEDGKLVSHTLTPAAQPQDTTEQILVEGEKALSPS